MTDSNCAAYYRAREQRERALAESAGDAAIGRIHLDMAERYAQLQVAQLQVELAQHSSAAAESGGDVTGSE